MRIGIDFGWITLVAAEMVIAETGLGFMVLEVAEFRVTASWVSWSLVYRLFIRLTHALY